MTLFADVGITRGEEDVRRVLDRQKKMEEAQTLQKFVNKTKELDEDITREIEELNMMSENCVGDINTVGTYVLLPVSLFFAGLYLRSTIRLID